MSSTPNLTQHYNNGTTEDLKHQNEKDKSFKTMSMKEKLFYCREIITIEPLVAFYAITGILCGPALRQLEYEKACRVDAGFNDTICEDILLSDHSVYGAENARVQIIITEMHAWLQPVQNIVPMILILFLGSYSDRHKIRKPFLLVPIFGELFSTVGCILCVIFMRQWPLAVQGFFQTVVPSFFGGPAMLLMAVFAYIADVSTLEMRTVRIGVVTIVLQVCSTVAQYISGILFAATGYVWVLIIGGVLFILALLYGIFFIKESHESVGLEDKKSWLADLFDPKHIVDTFSLLYKKNTENNRLHIIIVMVVLTLTALVVGGEADVFYNFTNIVYNWTVVEYAYLLGNNTLIHLIGTAITIPLFTKVLKFSDYTLILLSLFDKILFNIIVTIWQTVTGLYVGVFLSFITGLAVIGIRSLATKVVSINDLGKAQSLFAICEAIGPAIASPIYNKTIYQNTINSFISAFWLMGVALYFICMVLIMYIFISTNREMCKKKEENDIKMNNKDIEYDNEGYSEEMVTRM